MTDSKAGQGKYKMIQELLILYQKVEKCSKNNEEIWQTPTKLGDQVRGWVSVVCLPMPYSEKSSAPFLQNSCQECMWEYMNWVWSWRNFERSRSRVILQGNVRQWKTDKWFQIEGNWWITITTQCNACSWIRSWTSKEKESLLRQVAKSEWGLWTGL